MNSPEQIFRCYIVDDEPHGLAILKRYIAETPDLELAGASQSPVSALNDILKLKPDITFADIDMPEISGIELSNLVSGSTAVVFTTSFPDYALDAFEKNAYDYLLKPVSYVRFLASVKKVTSLLASNKESCCFKDHFFIKTEVKGKLIKVNVNDILFIEGLKNYIVIHTLGGKHVTYMSIKAVQDYLDPQEFSRVHRSFIINKKRLTMLNGNQAVLSDGSVVPMGDVYKKDFLETLNKSF